MAGTTTRLGLPYPTVSDAADIEQVTKPLADALDAIALAYAKGTHAARPTAAAGNGRIYYETDTGIAFFSDGANWQRLDQDTLNRILTLEAGVAALEAIDTVETSDTRLGYPGDVAWSAAAARPGCLLCDGTSYLRTAWPALFAALGGAASPWGLPDGTHFKVPDLRGRVPLMAGTGAGLTARVLAATGGEETHLLSELESGLRTHGHASGGDFATGLESNPHTHLQAGPSHFPTIYSGGPGGDVPLGWAGTGPGAQTGTESDAHSHGATDPATPAVAGAPAAAPHQNMPPWAALNAFIKT